MARRIRMHFAGINGKALAEANEGQDVLVSYADFAKSPALWTWMKGLIESGFFRSAILDSGAFTEVSEKATLAGKLRKGKITQAQHDELVKKVFKVDIDAFAAFARENEHLFIWVANLDDIGGDVERSNRNFRHLRAAGVTKLVPVFHEGESREQLAICVEMAKDVGMLAVGGQRPKGSLVPTNVVKFLHWLRAEMAAFPAGTFGNNGIALHGFGLPRYAADATIPGGEGFGFRSVDSTTWIAEACALYRSGAIADRHDAFTTTVASYHGIDWKVGAGLATPFRPVAFDEDVAEAFKGQARTVARRMAAVPADVEVAA